MIILGIETSCDETSVAVLEIDASERITIRSNIVSSQIKLHAPYGGVVPALAAREHLKNLNPVLKQALEEANIQPDDIHLVAVTSGPGLISSLLVGTTFAASFAWKYQLPIIGVNHMEGHIYSNWLGASITASIFPALCLVVSGGHTQLILMRGHSDYELIGQTHDDAAGEAFDKIARILELEYPGGPAIAREAARFQGPGLELHLPRPMIHSHDFNFSFSGLKTAVLYMVRDLIKDRPLEDIRTEIAHEAQQAIVETLISKTLQAANQHEVASIMLSGGVSANELLRTELQRQGEEAGLRVIIPARQFTTDNAAMIAIAGYYSQNNKSADELTWQHLRANANWEIV